MAVDASDEIDELLSARVGRPEHVLAEFGREADADTFLLGGRRHRAPGSLGAELEAIHVAALPERPSSLAIIPTSAPVL